MKNNFNLKKLESLKTYSFRIELCNNIGCKSTKPFSIKTTERAPIDWSSILPIFSVINATSLRFNWTEYSNLEVNSDLTYRLERSSISFAYPPMPLEKGIRFHGQNYFKFPAEKYFAEGYPYFGLKLNLKSKFESSIFYYATSSFAQSEFAAAQLYKSKPWFITNSQSNLVDCTIYLTTDDKRIFYSDNNWHDLEIFRLNTLAQIRFDNNTGSVDSSECTSNQIITDVRDVYLGGLSPQLMTKNVENGIYFNLFDF